MRGRTKDLRVWGVERTQECGAEREHKGAGKHLKVGGGRGERTYGCGVAKESKGWIGERTLGCGAKKKRKCAG